MAGQRRPYTPILNFCFFENYIDLDISGHHGEGQSFFFDDGPKCLSKYLDPIERGTAETRYVCNELTTFLTSCASLSRLHRSTEYAMLSPTRHSALEPSSIISKSYLTRSTHSENEFLVATTTARCSIASTSCCTSMPRCRIFEGTPNFRNDGYKH